MTYHIHQTPAFSPSTSRAASVAGTPRASMDASAARPKPQSKNTMSSIKKAFVQNTQDYWSQPSPLFTPRASIDASRNASRNASRLPSAANSRKPSLDNVNAAPVVAAKPEKKGGLINKAKRALNKNTEKYWGNPEMSAFYAAGLKM